MSPLSKPWDTVVPVASGVVFAIVVMVAIVLFTGPGETAETTTTTSTAVDDTTTTTTAPDETTTTTIAEDTTTTTPDSDFAGDTEPEINEDVTGDPGPSLTDLRFGAHPTFTRVVFEFIGDGEPAYHVRYEDPPFVTDGEGEEVEIDGDAFLVVTIMPGSTFDIDTGSATFDGERRISPGLDPIVEAVITGDFEGQLTWVIGLTGEQPFRVIVLQSPLRVVIDIASE